MDQNGHFEEQSELFDYLQLFLRRKVIVFVAFIVIFPITFNYFYARYKSVPLLFRTTFKLRLEPRIEKKRGADIYVLTEEYDPEHFASHIQRDYILSRVLKKVYSDQITEFNYIGFLDNLRKNSEVTAEGPIVTVTVSGSSSEQVFITAESWLEEIRAVKEEERKEITTKTVEVLSEQIERTKVNLTEAREELSRFIMENEILSHALRDGKVVVGPTEFSSRYLEVRRKREKLNELINRIQEIRQKEDDVKAFQFIAKRKKDLANLKLLQQRMDKQRELENLLLVNKEVHPDVIRAKQQLAVIEENISQDVEAAIDELGWSETELLREEEKLNELIGKGISKSILAYQKLQKEAEEAGRAYDALLKELDSFQLAKSLSQAVDFTVIEYPERSYRPYNYRARERKKLNGLLMSLVAALVGALALATSVESLDKSIRNIEDVESLGWIVLASIPRWRVSKGLRREVEVLKFPHSILTESFRSLRVNFKFSSMEKGVKTLAITSTLPQEGKSFIAANLAVMFAQAGENTLLIDADLRRPMQHRYFKTDNRKGLLNVLQGEKVEPTIYPSASNLSIISSGGEISQFMDLLKEQNLKDYFESLKVQYDWIIIDSPPVHLVGETLVIAKSVDCVVPIVRATKTLRRLFLRTKKTLENVNVYIPGVIINAVPVGKGYGYYYYYQPKK